MDNSNVTIASLLNQFINRNVDRRKINLKLGIVESVDSGAYTYQLRPADGSPLVTVDMTAQGSTQSAFIMVPEVGSLAIVGYTNDTDAYTVVVEKTETIIFNGGDNGGLINVEDLVTKLNNLESDINTLKTVFNSWVPAAGDGGAVLKSLAATWAAGSLTPTVRADIEDTKVKH